MRNLIMTAGVLASLTIAEGALAQDAAGGASASTSGQANVGVSLPGAAATTTAAAGGSDHAQMVGRLAVGYFGISNTQAGANLGGNDPSGVPFVMTGLAPVVGVRYWLDPMLGIDVGLGISVTGGSAKAPGATDSQGTGSFHAFLLHGGVPLALASSGHFTFEVIPELNVGLSGGSIDPNGSAAAGDVSYSGFHFDIGARAGAEINFGFIDVPQLSLVGTVGLRFDADSGSTNDTVPPAAGGAAPGKWSSNNSEFHTIVGSNPWAIFTNQIAALYYF